ncbi:MAG: hypothetical protein M1570_10810 [Chloroflexi bacterium]|nr:hypothetical protein [Chloroflexota bacterium]
MLVSLRVWSAPKHGNTSLENEDAFSPPRAEQDLESFHCALADGATETSFSRKWAQFLVHQYCRGEFDDGGLWRALPSSRLQWFRKVSSKPLPWYAEEKLRMGAYASLIGLRVYAPCQNRDGGAWQALAVGDSCLFQVRNGYLTVKWPLASSTLFGYHPILLSTKPAPKEESSEQTTTGDWAPGDVFYLMTDAIAQWYLSEVEKGDAPDAIVPNSELDSASEAFANWVSSLRDSGQMRNDDTTLMRLFLR